MKKEFLMKRVIPLVLALLMVGGTLLTLLPVNSYAANSEERALSKHEIDMQTIKDYPQVIFYDAGGSPIDIIAEFSLDSDPKSPYYKDNGLKNILLDDRSLSYTGSTVSYKHGDQERSWEYGKMDLIFAYVDLNYPIDDKTGTQPYPNEPENPNAFLKYDSATIYADSVNFLRSQKGYLISEIHFNGVDFLDDIHDKAQLYLQYVGDKASTPILCKGNVEYVFSRMKLSSSGNDNNNDNNGGNPKPPDNGNQEEEEPVIKSATPYIIVDEYSIGDQQVSAGDSFSLKLECTNTHKRIPIENIIMKVATSDGLQLTNSSNTFYIKSLGRGSSFDKELQISALPNAEAKSHTITLTFSYEYIADDARQKGEMSQEISIPVIQQDRFSADPVTGIHEATAGEELDITAKYINKSRGEIFNLTATLECDESIHSDEKIQHKGNIVPGGSGELEFTLNGSTPGTYPCAIVYTYEDALANTKQLRIPFEVTFVEAPVMDWTDPGMDMAAGNDIIYDENGNPIDPNAPVAPEGLSKEQIAAITVGVVLLLLIVTVIIIKKRKAAHEFEDDDENI